MISKARHKRSIAIFLRCGFKQNDMHAFCTPAMEILFSTHRWSLPLPLSIPLHFISPFTACSLDCCPQSRQPLYSLAALCHKLKCRGNEFSIFNFLVHRSIPLESVASCRPFDECLYDQGVAWWPWLTAGGAQKVKKYFCLGHPTWYTPSPQHQHRQEEWCYEHQIFQPNKPICFEGNWRNSSSA